MLSIKPGCNGLVILARCSVQINSCKWTDDGIMELVTSLTSDQLPRTLHVLIKNNFLTLHIKEFRKKSISSFPGLMNLNLPVDHVQVRSFQRRSIWLKLK